MSEAPALTSPNWKKPLLLATSLVAVSSFAIWLEYKHRPAQEEREADQGKVFDLKGQAVAQVKLRIGKTLQSFQCLDVSAGFCKAGDQSRWELTAPGKLSADDSNVNALLSAVANLSRTETISLVEDKPEKRKALLQDYGLSKEERDAGRRNSITVEPVNGPSRQLWVGEPHPLGNSVYALIEGQETEVLLVPVSVRAQFTHDLTWWRNKRITSLKSSDVKELRIISENQTVIASKKQPGQWDLSLTRAGQTDLLPGDPENLDGIVASATALQATRFGAENRTAPAALSLLKGTKTALTLILKDTAGKETELRFQEKGKGEKRQAYVLSSQADPVFEVEGSTSDRLNPSLAELRLSRLLTSMERFATKKLVFESKALGKEPLALSGADLNQDKTQQLLDRLSGNRIREFLTGAKIPSGEESGILVRLADSQDIDKKRLRFWKKGDQLYARDLDSKRSEVFVVDPSIWDMLPQRRDAFQAPAQPSGKAPDGNPSKPQQSGNS